MSVDYGYLQAVQHVGFNWYGDQTKWICVRQTPDKWNGIVNHPMKLMNKKPDTCNEETNRWCKVLISGPNEALFHGVGAEGGYLVCFDCDRQYQVDGAPEPDDCEEDHVLSGSIP
jgi:hypothetical protein